MKAKLIKESLLLEKMDTDTITVKVRKGTGENLKEILEFIRDNGNGGHSFKIDIDRDKRFPDEGKQFYWDGDGSDYIESIELN